MKLFARILFLTAVFSSVICSQHPHHDQSEPPPQESKKTELIDEFGRLGHCDLTSRFDTFFAQLSREPSSVGYVIVYQGIDVLPANYDQSGMERMFINHMYFRNFDSSRVVVMNGGFREDLRTELWIVPPGGEEPTPTATVPAPVMPTSETFHFDQSGLIHDDSGLLVQEFELPSVREKRKAEEERMRAEWEAESRSEASDPAPNAGVDGGEDTAEEPEAEAPDEEAKEPEAEAAEEEEYVDPRTPDEIEADRFGWVSEKFGALLEKRNDATGVMIFYADDETLDIALLADFMEQGKQRLAKAAGISPERITVRFGGYQDYPIVDYWIVPVGGEEPLPTPAERPVEEAEEPL